MYKVLVLPTPFLFYDVANCGYRLLTMLIMFQGKYFYKRLYVIILLLSTLPVRHWRVSTKAQPVQLTHSHRNLGTN